MDREAHVGRLKNEVFDVLVIGGGATGTGVALDAASRGLNVALVERDDYAAGTSSRSTKLIHGGVRYLEQAVLKFDRSQFRLVRDALHERATLLRIAPHLTHALPLLTPLYNRMEVPYYRTGLRLYDRLAGKSSIHKSFFVTRKEALKRFPMLKPEKLRGGVVYYDGQFDDARMNVCIALTSAELGAAVANHVEVVGLLRQGDRIAGASVRDRLSGAEWEIKATTVVNAAGPFLDKIRWMDQPRATPMLTASSGTHLVFGREFTPPGTGLLIPKTEDGRVLFFLPWHGAALVGTTDNPAPIEDNPQPSHEDVEYILRQLRRYFAVEMDESHIRSAWTGLRPLVSNPKAADTARLSRDHVIHVSDHGLITIAGGKWTTYRRMAQDTVNQAIRTGDLKPKGPSRSEVVPIAGGERFNPAGDEALVRDYGISPETATYLNRAYGDRASEVLESGGSAHRRSLAEGHPYLENEVFYSAKKEGARNIVDVLARRVRVAFLDHKAALSCIPKVGQLLGAALKWDKVTQEKEIAVAREYFSY